MGAPRTFVSFSSTDILHYRLMCAWKAHEHIEFNFVDCQLEGAINSEDESYIKRKCRERIDMAGTFIILIGKDTKSKYKYVKWEIEVAIEKGCRIIAVNLDGGRVKNDLTCPPVLEEVGALFVPFNAAVIAYALNDYVKKSSGNYHYKQALYNDLGV